MIRPIYCNGTTYTIQEGDTLYSISRRYNVPLSLILRANPFINVYNLQIGAEICIPTRRPFAPGPIVPVRPMRERDLPPADSSLSEQRTPQTEPEGDRRTIPPEPMSEERYEVDEEDMADEPDLSSPYLNDSIQDPDSTPNRTQTNDIPEHSDPLPAFAHTVEDGESIGMLMRRYQMNENSLWEWNQPDDILLKPGSTLNIPR